MRLRLLHMAYPSIHSCGVVHWVPEQLNIKPVTGHASWLCSAKPFGIYATEIKSTQLHAAPLWLGLGKLNKCVVHLHLHLHYRCGIIMKLYFTRTSISNQPITNLSIFGTWSQHQALDLNSGINLSDCWCSAYSWTFCNCIYYIQETLFSNLLGVSQEWWIRYVEISEYLRFQIAWTKSRIGWLQTVCVWIQMKLNWNGQLPLVVLISVQQVHCSSLEHEGLRSWSLYRLWPVVIFSHQPGNQHLLLQYPSAKAGQTFTHRRNIRGAGAFIHPQSSRLL